MNSTDLAIEITLESWHVWIKISAINFEEWFIISGAIQLFLILIIQILFLSFFLRSGNIGKLTQGLGRFSVLTVLCWLFAKLKIFRPGSILNEILIKLRVFRFVASLALEFKFFIFFISWNLKCLIYLLFCNLFASVASSTKAFALLTRLSIIRLIELCCLRLVSWWGTIIPFLSLFVAELALLNNLEPVFLFEFILFRESLTEDCDFTQINSVTKSSLFSCSLIFLECWFEVS
jgi:hypothetical protein